MKLRAILVALLMLVVVTACGHPNEGKIYGKDYKAPYTTSSIYCAAYNTKGVCTLWLPNTQNHPECWRLLIRNDEDTWTVCTYKEYWEQAQNEQTWKETS